MSEAAGIGHQPRTGPAGAAPSVELRHNRDFRVVLVGQGVSAVGDGVSLTALPLLVILLTGSGVQMGLVGVLQTLPDLLFGLPIGALADRWDRRRMMLYADLGRALLTALIPLSVVLGLPVMTVILVVTAPINLCRVAWLAAWTAAMPALVGREQLGRANGYVEAIFSLGFILGPGIAGVLTGLIGPAPTIALDAATFAISAASLSFLRRPLRPTREAARESMRKEIAEGVRFIVNQPTLRAAVTFWGLVSVVSGPLIPVAIYFLTVDRGLPPQQVGLAISAFSVGYLVGSLVTARFDRRRIGLFMLLANGAGAVLAFALAFAPSMGLIFVATGLLGLAESLVLISYITLRATIPPDELLGRVGSTARMISVGLQPIGLFTAGLLLDGAGGQATIILIGALMLAVTAAFALSRALREATLSGALRPADTG